MVALPLTADICVIGAGAAGLCTARHLLRCGFRPYLLEKSAQHAVGGLWHVDSHRTWPNLTTNLSKFSCCFSDFPWPTTTTTSPTIFPNNLQMQEYLQAYANHYILNGNNNNNNNNNNNSKNPEDYCNAHVRMGCTVTKVRRDDTGSKYHVEWTELIQSDDTTTTTTASPPQQEFRKMQQVFDGVVIASGFYSKPLWPTLTSLSTMAAGEEEDEEEWRKRLSDFKGRILHSVQYQHAEEFRHKTVAVCGASFSALELCADIAKHAQPVKVINILPRIPWILPRWMLRSDSSIWPIDLLIYQRQEHGVAPKVDQSLVLTNQGHRAKHDYLRKLVGIRRQQSILGLPDPTQPAMVSITDDYLELVASQHIQVVHGRLAGSDKTNHNTLTLDNGETVANVDDLICCTGFGPDLSYLDPALLETLQWNERDRFAPLSLAFEVFHPQLPGLAFCGMHRGQYFAYMELQARLIAEVWSGRCTNVHSATLDDGLCTSQQIRQQLPRPQFPRGDYIGYLDSLASLVDLVPTDEFGKKGMVALPALYQPDRDIAVAALQDMEQQVAKQQEAQMSKLALTALVGNWTFSRTISHFPLSDTTSLGKSIERQDTVTGQIQFTSRTVPSGTGTVVHYREDGIFKTDRGVEMEVFREYEYVHNPHASALEIYFVEGGGQRANLFLSLRFRPNPNDNNNTWLANNDHLCVKDLYKGSFTMEWNGMDLTRVVMTYRVQGPEKNYEAVTELLPTN